MYNVDKDVNSY